MTLLNSKVRNRANNSILMQSIVLRTELIEIDAKDTEKSE